MRQLNLLKQFVLFSPPPIALLLNSRGSALGVFLQETWLLQDNFILQQERRRDAHPKLCLPSARLRHCLYTLWWTPCSSWAAVPVKLTLFTAVSANYGHILAFFQERHVVRTVQTTRPLSNLKVPATFLCLNLWNVFIIVPPSRVSIAGPQGCSYH